MGTRVFGKALGHWRRAMRLPGAWRLLSPMWMLASIACLGLVGTAEAGAGPLPSFHEIEHPEARKQRFFAYLTPLIQAENDRIRAERRRLRYLAAAWRAGRPLSRPQALFLDDLGRKYRLETGELARGELIDRLTRRVDVIPKSLVLAQAAKESGWGSSRFARKANNLFGQWCFERGCGLVPRQRPAGMRHEVRSFPSVRESLAAYMRNLNTHSGYRSFRELRARLRAARRPLSGMLLAEGLTRYSARGESYVREVQTMIRQNALETGGFATAVTGS